MRRLPLGMRLFLNILVFSIPILVLTYLMYDSETVNIEFGRKESIGNELQSPYEKLMRATAMAKLGEVLHDASYSHRYDVTEYKNKLEVSLKNLGDSLLFTKEGLASRKREAASLNVLSDALANKKWDEAINSLKVGITHLGDTSNLILDPDLDSYYLMDITLLALPQMQDRVQVILADRGRFFTNERITGPQRIQAALYAAMLNESDLQRIIGDSQTALNEDKNFYGVSPTLQKNLPDTVNLLKAKAEHFIDLLNKLSRAEAVSEQEFTEVGISLLDQSYDSWEVASGEMTQLLANRMNILSQHRSRSLGMAGVALLFAILFSIVVGVSLSQSIRSILDSVLKLKSASQTTLEIGTDLSDKSKDVSQSVSTQAASIEETAASIEEINSMVKITAENSKQASRLAEMTNQTALGGEEALNTMLASMGEIAASSKRIVETIGVIDDIAFQTNLLALNASVEAARAGEQGKGFAVVADAVRALAQKSAVAAKEINELVQNNVVVIEKGRQGASRSADSLREIINYVKKLNQLIVEIAGATTEQGAGISQISKAINDIEIEATRNQQGVSNFSESAGLLLRESQQLSLIIRVLEQEVLGGSKQVGPDTILSDEIGI